MRNMDQKRADWALEKINDVDHDEHINQKEYGSLARSLPMMIQVNGLGQTLAFLKSKASKNIVHEHLYDHLSGWLNDLIRNERQGDFLDWIVEQDTSIYRQASTEAIEFSIWLRRFAESKGWSD